MKGLPLTTKKKQQLFAIKRNSCKWHPITDNDINVKNIFQHKAQEFI